MDPTTKYILRLALEDRLIATRELGRIGVTFTEGISEDQIRLAVKAGLIEAQAARPIGENNLIKIPYRLSRQGFYRWRGEQITIGQGR